MIDVYVHDNHAGVVSREGRDFIFTYHTTNPDLFVSLTMPVRQKSYVFQSNQLHPIFNQFIPEGYLFDIFKSLLLKSMESLDELKLLSVLAPAIKGRLSFIPRADHVSQLPAGESLDKSMLSLDFLLHSKQDLFETLLRYFLRRSAIGGIQPKVLAELHDKINISYDEYIVKTNGEAYPHLTENEFFCLSAAKRAGLPVPEFYLSDDKKLLVIRRFTNTQSDNTAMGFEEVAVLLGKTNMQKYEGSYEQIAKALASFCAPQYKNLSLKQFFTMLVLSVIIRNGDAHLKNFGIIYTKGYADAMIAPAYDLVCTTCYLPNDVPALTLDGKKIWWNKKKLLAFGEQHCLLAKTQALETWDICIQAVEDTRAEITRYLQEEPAFKEIGQAMCKQWLSKGE